MGVYAIGDIHGCLKALKTVFHESGINPEDLVVFLGDYVDRGPNSKQVLDWLIEHSKQYNFVFILGNHELMMLAARESQNNLLGWLRSGGSETLNSYQIESGANLQDSVDQAHWDFIENCKPYLEIDKYLFVHAGLEKGKALDKQDEQHLFWKKFEVPEAYRPNRKVICGHTSRKDGEIANFGHTICIDTYAYGGMWLTCLNVETLEYVQASNEGANRMGRLDMM